MPLIGLSGEALGRHARVLRSRGRLQDVKQVEADRLLDLHGRPLGALCANIPDPEITTSPEIVHVLLLGSEQLLESLARYAIHGPLGAAAEFFRRSRPRGVINNVLSELDRRARPR